MSIIKSFSVEDINGLQGDMFYIKHDNSNFTIIDCCLNDDTRDIIINEIISERNGKNITRFISTHPDEDHICGLEYLDDKIRIVNFYCVDNNATKKDESESFKHYCKLRDGDSHFYLEAGCSRKWMNLNDENDGRNYGSSGINCLWPLPSDDKYKGELEKAQEGTSFNNISPIIKYQEDSATVLWMGDLETDFVEKIKNKVDWPEVDIVFAPHHGRESGKIPSDVLKKLNPSIIVIGEAPSEYLDYYSGYNTIKQNSARDIVFKCEDGKIHIYVSSDNYSEDFLKDEYKYDYALGNYIGSIDTKE